MNKSSLFYDSNSDKERILIVVMDVRKKGDKAE